MVSGTHLFTLLGKIVSVSNRLVQRATAVCEVRCVGRDWPRWVSLTRHRRPGYARRYRPRTSYPGQYRPSCSVGIRSCRPVEHHILAGTCHATCLGMLDMIGHVWTCLDMFGYVWTCLDMFGHVWTCLDMFWPLPRARGPWTPWTLIYDLR